MAVCAHKCSTKCTSGTEAAGKKYVGWLQMHFDVLRSQLAVTVRDSLGNVLPLVIRRARAAFDLNADPPVIIAVLHEDFPTGDGVGVPGALDGFELAVRAVLGQQITVPATRTLAQGLVNHYGEPIATPWPELTRLFPPPAILATAYGDELGQLGIVRQRQAAIVGLANAVKGCLQLHGGADLLTTLQALKALPDIGDWTAQYIAMRALRWPDAFPAGDVVLHKARGVQGLKNSARLAEAASVACKPWRSYAVVHTWSGAWRGTEA